MAPDNADVTGWSRTSFEALGSTAVVAVTEPRALEEARAIVEHVVDEFDRACSRFRPDSELMRVNEAAGRPVPASSTLLDAVAAAQRAAELTDGAVDPTVGEALIALGYERDFAAVATATAAAPVRVAAVPGWRTVHVDRVAGTVKVASGVRLDLGATAKALAADRAAAAANGGTGAGVLVSLGGDIALHGAAPPGGWTVRVTDDHRSDERAPGQSITLAAGGLATSSTTVRRWRTGDGSAHHLIDPASGRPVESFWRTVSVTAASCLDANIASTASMIRGEPALGWLQSLGLPSRLVGEDGLARHVGGWPHEGDDLPSAS